MSSILYFVFPLFILYLLLFGACNGDGTGVDKRPGVHVYYSIEDAIKNEYGYTSVQWLLLVDRNVESLPLRIGQCTEIELISVAKNKLSSLPDTLRNCRSLVEFDASNNLFERTPVIRKALLSVEYNDNRISEIDTALRNYELDYLRLRNNRITSWPESLYIFGGKDLIELDIRGNPLSENEVNKIRTLMPNTKVLF